MKWIVSNVIVLYLIVYYVGVFGFLVVEISYVMKNCVKLLKIVMLMLYISVLFVVCIVCGNNLLSIVFVVLMLIVCMIDSVVMIDSSDVVFG